MGLQAGFARACVTPPVGAYMAGYAARSGPAEGVHDDLYASAVALSDGASMVVVLAVDNCSFDAEGDQELRGAVQRRTRLDPERLLVNTSHTHAGPMINRRAYQPFEAGYLGALLVQCADAVAGALDDLRPATLGVGEAPLEIGMNRRQQSAEGQVVLGTNQEGLRLPYVTAWRLTRAGAPDIVLWSAAVHGVSLSHENRLISAEWMGASVRNLESAEPGLRAVFLQGCAGDQNPVGGPQRGDGVFVRMVRLGAEAAEAVRGALRGAREVAALPLRYTYRMVPLPLAGGGVWEHPVHGVRLGDALLVALSGEPFAEYGRYGRERSPAASTMMLGYSDGTRGYLPTEAAYAEGGYEPEAYVWYTDGKALDPSLEGVLKREIDGVLRELMDW